MISQVANKGEFVLGQMSVDPLIEGVIENGGIERKENFRGETGYPILKADEKGRG